MTARIRGVRERIIEPLAQAIINDELKELMQAGLSMRRKRRARSKPVNQESQVPDWVLDKVPKRRKPYTKAEIDELTAGVQAGIEDTPVWKEYVRRFGKKEAVRILKVGLFRTHIIQGDPNN